MKTSTQYRKSKPLTDKEGVFYNKSAKKWVIVVKNTDKRNNCRKLISLAQVAEKDEAIKIYENFNIKSLVD